MKRITTLLLVGAIGGIWASTACAALFRNTPGEKTSRVLFRSEATLESIVGKTNDVSAEFTVDFTDLTRTRGTVTVELASLDTGLGLRNKHMRENHLETDSHPSAIFKMTGLSLDSAGALEGGRPLPVTVTGDFNLHGHTKTLTAHGRILLLPATAKATDRRLRIDAAFPVALADYQISRPKFLFLKVAETVQITVDIMLTEVLVE